ncbi:mitochondrial ribosomal protein subunit L20-domain-containing protein [Radiomyces spectabilis]|uniref:mitochondrial ribosomal protein subunit L20-domain-containing protein n=1 Tax=Radiomyces spectabilis TaxID=64574 RepID=UPI0022200CE5|nr:mitochondrial ribosomal protein subunit L20-domain-containing protein [Radiomyces spectabilis]KAI8379436.1 mitochondrial ribosomal protein subunit L20-domain-containing protein [Radiomyces spectabilis]
MFRSASSVQRFASSVRTYATKSKTTNLKMTARVPVVEESLKDGSVFITRQPPVQPQVQATAPPLRAPYEKQRHLTEDQIAEMRRLRNQDPAKWTRKALAKKFNCSDLFVSIVAPTTKRSTNAAAVVDTSSEQGYRRQLIAKNRQRRRELW